MRITDEGSHRKQRLGQRLSDPEFRKAFAESRAMIDCKDHPKTGRICADPDLACDGCWERLHPHAA